MRDSSPEASADTSATQCEVVKTLSFTEISFGMAFRASDVFTS